MTLSRSVSPQSALQRAMRGYDRVTESIRHTNTAERTSADQLPAAIEHQLAQLPLEHEGRTGVRMRKAITRAVRAILAVAEEDRARLAEASARDAYAWVEHACQVASVHHQDCLAAADTAVQSAQFAGERIVTAAHRQAAEIRATAATARARQEARANRILDATHREATRANFDAGRRAAIEDETQAEALGAEIRAAQADLQAARREVVDEQTTTRRTIREAEQHAAQIREAAIAAATDVLRPSEESALEVEDQTGAAMAELATAVAGMINELVVLHEALTEAEQAP